MTGAAETILKPKIEHWHNGNKKSEYWLFNKKFHRIGGPAIQRWHENGNKEREEWYRNEYLHRVGEPAVRWWYENGNIKFESWLQNDIYHRFNGPACQYWSANGYKECEYWSANGYKECEYWYLNGIEYEKEDHPFNKFRDEYKLSKVYDEWPDEMKVLFEVIYR